MPKNCRFTFAELMEQHGRIAAFKASAKSIHVSAKRRSYAAALREFKALYRPSQWYCVTREGPMFKDDSIQVWYLNGSQAEVRESPNS
jgi:hypothetical protein